MENRIIGDINLISIGGQFREQGSVNIIEPSPLSEFNTVFMDNMFTNAYFCDFSGEYPYTADPSLSELYVAMSNIATLFDNLRIRSFNSVDDGNIFSLTWNAVITRYLPWIYAVDSSEEQTHALSVRLSRKNPNHTPGSWLSPTDTYGYRTTQLWSGGTNPIATDNTLYKFEIQAAANITVKAFGLMYDFTLIKP